MTKDATNGSTPGDTDHAAPIEGGSGDDPAQRSGSSSSESSAPGWLAALKSSLGFAPGSLREMLEQALKEDGGESDAFSAEERAMLARMLRYGGLRVDDLMVPRADIIAVDEDDSICDVLKVFVESGVSRVPIYNETLDDPRGVVHVKDLLHAMVREAAVASAAVPPPGLKNGNGAAAAHPQTSPEAALEDRAAAALGVGDLDLSRVDLDRPIGRLKVRRDVLYVPPSMPAMNLLLRMQSTRCHMALVVDEYGGTDGLVTIEDLVEEIVGDIDDEHDEAEEEMILSDAGAALVASARTPVEDLEARLGLKLLGEDDEDDIDTIGGLVFTLVGRVPSRGELIPHPAGVEFEVLDADPRRIKRLKIHPAGLAPREAAAPEARASIGPDK